MTPAEFLQQMDEIMDLPPGTLSANERLADIKNWDSTSLITFIALAESNNGKQVSPGQVVGCTTVADLLRLAQVDGCL